MTERYVLVRSRLDGGVNIVPEHRMPWLWGYAHECLAAGSLEACEAAKRLIGEYYCPQPTVKWVIR